MSTSHRDGQWAGHQRPLAAALALMLGTTAGAIEVKTAPVGNVIVVNNCNDSGAGSLRETIASAGNGFVIDMGGLDCSTITLTSGSIAVHQESLHLHGPGADALEIDGNFNDRVFVHDADGVLDIEGVTVGRGKYFSNVADARGGCIVSAGSVTLTDAAIVDCVLVGRDDALVRGGGVTTQGNLSLIRSTLSGNTVIGSNTGAIANAEGGGAVVFGTLNCKYSVISGNAAIPGEDRNTSGGAFQTFGSVVIGGSTLSGNYATSDGAITIQGSSGSAVIFNSTISGNSANSTSAIYTQLPLTVANSTIAFNRALFHRGALYSQHSPLVLQSTIIAGNELLGIGESADVTGTDATVVSGSNNLITSSNIELPADTITDCPRLAPLADNGGPTRTHALRNDSPAIDAGNNVNDLDLDQRGEPRVAGAVADIGAYEWQQSVDEFLLASGFEPVCDQ